MNEKNGGYSEMVEKILKRDGREVDFSIEKIANAVYQAAKATGGKDFDG